MVTEVRNRRRRFRFPLAMRVAYQTTSRCWTNLAGAGRIVNISSTGALIWCELSPRNLLVQERLTPGKCLELAVEWPVLLHGRVPLKLTVRAKVVRVTEDGFAVRFGRGRAEFKTTRAKEIAA